MSAQAFFIMSIAGYALAALMFVIVIILFFHKNVIGIINDLSGKTAAKQINEIRKKNITTESAHKVSSMYEQLENRGRIDENQIRASKTSQMSHVSRRLDINNNEEPSKKEITNSQKGFEVESEQPTDVLRPLNNVRNSFIVPCVESETPTNVLSQDNCQPMSEADTTVLKNESTPDFRLICDMESVFTDEIIG